MKLFGRPSYALLELLIKDCHFVFVAAMLFDLFHQKRCTFILCIEKFETARESMVDEINDDLPMISMNEKVKQRLRYLWRLNQLRKEWSIKLGNEFPTKGPRIVQYKVYISEEDKKKLAELKRLQGI